VLFRSDIATTSKFPLSKANNKGKEKIAEARSRTFSLGFRSVAKFIAFQKIEAITAHETTKTKRVACLADIKPIESNISKPNGGCKVLLNKILI
jgi:hypothetical protein